MNVIEWLVEDHDKLRRELVNIRKNLCDASLKKRVKNFAFDLEFHESIEEEILFSQMGDHIADEMTGKAMSHCEDAHDEIWRLIDELLEKVDQHHFSDLQQCFFYFDATVEAHIRHEEHILFPRLLQLLDKSLMEDLSRKVEERTTKFSMQY